MYKKLIGIGSAILGLALTAGVTFAAPGDAVQSPIPECVGIGVAYDGTNILYTCAGDASIYKTDLTGANNGSVAIVDAVGAPVSVDAIAWDSNENKLWGGDLDGAGNCRIWSIDMITGVGTFRFSFTDPSLLARCSVSFFDGLTVDTVTDTIYASPDVHTHIRHFNKDGTPATNDSIDFTGLTAGECPWAAGFGAAGCWNSGLAMGLDGNLFAGTASDGKIYRLDPNTPASLGVFASVSGRDEDLECGPVVDGKETILSKQFEGPIDVLEAPEGTCVSPVVPQITLDPPTDINGVGEKHTVTATVTVNNNPLANTLVSFSVVVGPNTAEVSDPGECTVDPNCNTDPSGQTSWTYTGSGGVGVDVIQACFTDERDEEHCARVEKEWIDKTPPEAKCVETVNPHGNTVPPAGKTTLPGPRGGQNEDGYYELLATDNLPGIVQIFVNGFGPFNSGDKIKVTEAPGATPSQKKIGSIIGQAGAILWHLILNSDPVMTAIDAAGNQTTVSCLVPPPPK